MFLTCAFKVDKLELIKFKVDKWIKGGKWLFIYKQFKSLYYKELYWLSTEFTYYITITTKFI